jgi:lipopolysaccharide transport system permease protein
MTIESSRGRTEQVDRPRAEPVSPPHDEQPIPEVLIEPPRGWEALNLREIWEYRELLYFLTWRDIKVRYKQTAIGAAWAIIQPVTAMVIFSVIFGELMNVPSEGLPYPVFSYAALLPWNFFAGALTRSANSLVQDVNLISKVYFPRLILPMAAVLSLVVDFAIAFVILLGIMLYYGILPGVAVLALPFFLLLAFLTAISVGIWLAALYVKYRDIGYVIPFLINLWLFVTPVVYPSSIIPTWLQPLYALNPMAGVVEGFRWALLGQESAPGLVIAVSTVAVLLLFVSGLFYFRRMENEFADVV